MGSIAKGSAAVTPALGSPAAGTSERPPNDGSAPGRPSLMKSLVDPSYAVEPLSGKVTFQRLKDGTYGPAMKAVAQPGVTNPNPPLADPARVFAQRAAALIELRLNEQGLSARNELRLTGSDVEQLRRALREADTA